MGVAFDELLKALRDGYFLLFLIAIFFLWGLYDLRKTLAAFHKEEPLLRKALTTLSLFIVAGSLLYLQFHKTNKVPVNVEHDGINKQIICTHEDDKCKFEGSNLECGSFGENNSSQYECVFENRIRATFTWPDPNSETLKLENVFYEIDDLKLSTDNTKLYATFNLHSPVTDQMIDLPDKSINVTMCGMSTRAIPNKNSTYTVTTNWNDFELLAQKNCKDSICIDQNERGCYAKKTFDIVLPLGKKHIHMKDNAYIFYGDVRQNNVSIPVKKTNFEIKAKVRLLTPATCFTLVAGDDIIKIENDIVSINREAVGIAKLATDETINITIQKNSQNFIVYIGQDDGIGEPIILPNPETIKDHIDFGFTIAKKTKKKVLELSIDEVRGIR